MTHLLATYDTNGWQTEFAKLLEEAGWDDHHRDDEGKDRRLPNTALQSSKFANYPAAKASFLAARNTVRTKYDPSFTITHLAIGQFLKAEGGAIRKEATAARVTRTVRNAP